MFDRAALERAVAAHGRVARIVLAEVRGSAPRASGTAMLVWLGGQSGTIGGGRLEFEAIADARTLLRAGSDRSLRRAPLGPTLGQCCGGAVTLVTEVFDAGTLPVAATVYLRPVVEDAGTPPPALTRLRAGSGRGNAPALVRGWLAEPMGGAFRPVSIYGAGHVGRALSRVLAPLSRFAVNVADPRPDWLAALPNTVRTLTDQPALVNDSPAETAHFVMTHDHDLDLDLCHRLLGRDFAFAGLIGSATKWARFRGRLQKLGHSDEQIARIACPIGDPSLGKEPQAIAIGVAARLMEWDAHQDAKGTV